MSSKNDDIDLEIQRLTNNIAIKTSYQYIQSLNFKEASTKIEVGTIGDLGTIYIRNGQYIFVEAKAGDATLSAIKVPNEPFMAEQGSLMYLKIVLVSVEKVDKPLYDILMKAIETNELRYFFTFQGFNEDESFSDFEIKEFAL